MRKLSSSQPVSVTTQVAGLTASLVFEESGPMRQWYSYDSGDYVPNRESTPLIINAHVELVDNATSKNYIANLVGGVQGGTRWRMRTTVGAGEPGEWTDVSTAPPTESEPNKIWQVRTDTASTLYIKKNIEPEKKIELKCIMEYAHPQLAGYTYMMEQILLLCTNEDSDIINPSLRLNTPPSWIYDPLLDNNIPGDDTYHIRTISAYAVEGAEDVTSGVYFYWSIFENGIEYPVGADNNHPCYVSGGLNGSSSLVVDAMYSESFTIKCKAKDRKSTPEAQAAAEFYEDELSVDITWKPLEVDKKSICKNGSMIRFGEYPFKDFTVAISRKGKIFTDEEIDKNFLFCWKKRIETTSAEALNETVLGWGRNISVKEEDVANQNNRAQRSVNVFAEVYLKGAYANVVQGSNNIVCTINGTKYNIISRS